MPQYLRELASHLRRQYPHMTYTEEIDDTATYQTSCIRCNVSIHETEAALVIEIIKVSPRLQRTGRGIGETLVHHIRDFAGAAGLYLQAHNVHPGSYGFWRHARIGFAPISTDKRRWQYDPLPAPKK